MARPRKGSGLVEVTAGRGRTSIPRRRPAPRTTPPTRVVPLVIMLRHRASRPATAPRSITASSGSPHDRPVAPGSAQTSAREIDRGPPQRLHPRRLLRRLILSSGGRRHATAGRHLLRSGGTVIPDFWPSTQPAGAPRLRRVIPRPSPWAMTLSSCAGRRRPGPYRVDSGLVQAGPRPA